MRKYIPGRGRLRTLCAEGGGTEDHGVFRDNELGKPGRERWGSAISGGINRELVGGQPLALWAPTSLPPTLAIRGPFFPFRLCEFLAVIESVDP